MRRDTSSRSIGCISRPSRRSRPRSTRRTKSRTDTSGASRSRRSRWRARLGITDALTLQAIEAAALLHDTGKIAVPEHILNKPGKLTPAEFEKMKLHAPIGAEILSAIEFPYPVVPIVRHHHENWDGTGYPDRIAGEAIPIGARILSVVDCFDALTSDRPYRRRMSNADALAILIERRGTMYDPAIVDTFVRVYERIMPASEAVAHPVATHARRGAGAEG